MPTTSSRQATVAGVAVALVAATLLGVFVVRKKPRTAVRLLARVTPAVRAFKASRELRNPRNARRTSLLSRLFSLAKLGAEVAAIVVRFRQQQVRRNGPPASSWLDTLLPPSTSAARRPSPASRNAALSRPATARTATAVPARVLRTDLPTATPARPPIIRSKHIPLAEENVDFRVLGRVVYLAAQRWSEQRAASKSAALALYTLFSLSPILILVIAIGSAFFGHAAVSGEVVNEMRVLMGDSGASVIQTVMTSVQNSHQGLVAGIISFAVVIFGATSAFAELKDSLDELWGVGTRQSSGVARIVRERFLALGLLFILTALLLASLLVGTGLNALEGFYGHYWDASKLATPTDLLLNAISFVVVAALFASIYKLLPSAYVAWRDVILGSIITAALFVVGKSAIGVYLAHGFVSSAYGAAGSVVALIAWVYYSTLIFFYGALLTHEYALQIGSRRGLAAHPDGHAAGLSR